MYTVKAIGTKAGSPNGYTYQHNVLMAWQTEHDTPVALAMTTPAMGFLNPTQLELEAPDLVWYKVPEAWSQGDSALLAGKQRANNIKFLKARAMRMDLDLESALPFSEAGAALQALIAAYEEKASIDDDAKDAYMGIAVGIQSILTRFCPPAKRRAEFEPSSLKRPRHILRLVAPRAEPLALVNRREPVRLVSSPNRRGVQGNIDWLKQTSDEMANVAELVSDSMSRIAELEADVDRMRDFISRIGRLPMNDLLTEAKSFL